MEPNDVSSQEISIPEELRNLFSQGNRAKDTSNDLSNMISLSMKAVNTPNITNELQLPTQFFHPVIELQSNGLFMEKMPTLVVGTETKGYTQEMFDRDFSKVKKFFSLEESIYPVFLKPVSQELNRILDTSNATSQVHSLIELMNSNTELGSLELYRKLILKREQGNIVHFQSAEETIAVNGSPNLRIVSVGVSYSEFIFQALNYLLRNWSASYKHVYFITSSEPGQKYFDFWKKACVMNLCHKVQYVNLEDYKPFGYYKE